MIICIPKIKNHITKQFICKIFNKYNFGNIIHIDLINKFNNKRAFIHYNFNNNKKTLQIKEWLLEGKDIKIIYNEPWYWKCSAFKANKYVTT